MDRTVIFDTASCKVMLKVPHTFVGFCKGQRIIVRSSDFDDTRLFNVWDVAHQQQLYQIDLRKAPRWVSSLFKTVCDHDLRSIISS